MEEIESMALYLKFYFEAVWNATLGNKVVLQHIWGITSAKASTPATAMPTVTTKEQMCGGGPGVATHKESTWPVKD